MSEEDHHRKLEHMYLTAPCNVYYRPRILVSKGQAEVNLDVREDFFHAAGAAHGAVLFKLLDDAAYFACNSLVKDCCVLTVHFDIQLFRPVSEGTLRAVGEVEHRSRRILFAKSRVFDGRNREIACGSGTFHKSSIPLSSEMGYA
jgi:uncharacterized protein (TIGR00369 family)